jgi:alanine dehydrogenase
MSDSPKRYQVPRWFASSGFETALERLEVKKNPQQLFIGIPKETTLQENRVALVPSAVASLIGYGHRIIIESGAGEKSNYQDSDYSEAGAEIAYSLEEVYKANILIKVAPPSQKETKLLIQDQVIISPLQIPIITEDYVETIHKKKAIAIAMEYLMDSDGSFPLVRIMSEMAGLNAILTAAELLSNVHEGKGILLGGVSGVPPCKVIILGAGVVGEFATRAALGLGAQVYIFDNNIYKLMRIKSRVGQQVYTSVLNPVNLEKELLDADVVIGAIHSETGRSPIVVSEDMVSKMLPGSVIIDVSIDQGGCIETSQVTSHTQPTFRKYDVIHYCVPNIASKVARTASVAVSNILTPILIKAGESHNIDELLYNDHGIRHGVYAYKGFITNQYLAQRFHKKFTDLDLLLASSF